MKKQHLSVLMLMARSTIYKILVLLLVMAAVEAGLFYYALSRGFDELSYGLELMIRQSRISWVFIGAFILLTYLLTQTGWKGGSKQGYTLMRLSVSEGWVFFWQSTYNALCYVLLWAVQVLLAMAFCRVYTAWAPEGYVTGQTVFLAIYRSEFLHMLFPMEDLILWLTNILVVIALGICSAHYPVVKRRGERFDEIVGLMAGVILFGREGGGIGDVAYFLYLAGFALVAAAVALFRMFREEETDETEEA